MSILERESLGNPILDFDGGRLALLEITHLSVAKVDRFLERSAVRVKSSSTVGESARDDLICRGGKSLFLNLKYPDRRDLDSLEVQGPISMVRDAADGYPSIGDIQYQTH